MTLAKRARPREATPEAQVRGADQRLRGGPLSQSFSGCRTTDFACVVTGWPVVDSTNRHPRRLLVLDPELVLPQGLGCLGNGPLKFGQKSGRVFGALPHPPGGISWLLAADTSLQ